MKLKEISLSYGEGKKPLYISESNLAGFLKPVSTRVHHRPEEMLQFALDNPVESRRLEDLVAGKKVCVTVEDYSRSEPHREMVSALSTRMSKAAMVQYIIATGTHNPTDERNLRIESMIEEVAESCGLSFDVAINDCMDSHAFDPVGVTSRGTEVLINRKALDADIFVSAAAMKPHYFAGYSAAKGRNQTS